MPQKNMLTHDMLKVFETVPDLYLILSPNLHVLTASDAYLSATLTKRHEIVGKHIFEVFPDNPNTPEANSVQNLHASLQEVLTSLKPHQMELQRYDVPQASGKDGDFERKYWIMVNTPVLNERGEVSYIIHKVSDITKQYNDRQYIQELSDREQAALNEANWQQVRLIDFFMQAPVAIGIYGGENHVIELANPLMCEVMGRSPREILGKPIFEALPELIGQGYEKILSQVYTTGVPYEAKESPATLLRNDRLIQGFYHTVYHPLKDPQGSINGIINVVIDVSNQVADKKKIEESERQLRLITNAMPVLIGYLDREEKYRFANQAYQSWFHQKPENLFGRPIRDVIGDKAYQGVKQYIDRAMSGERLDFEARMPYREDFVKHIRTSYVPDIQEGEVAGFFTLVTDITEQIEARKALEEREQYFRMMADNVPVMIWVTRPDGQCTYLNKRWYDFTGQTEDTSLGLGWLEVVHPDDAEYSKEIFLKANAEQQAFELTYRLKGKDGKYRWAIDTGLPKFDKEGKFEGLVGAVIDIHERYLSEEARQQISMKLATTNEELRAANEKILASNDELAYTNLQLSYINADMDNFIYTASHDLKAPISNIEGLMTAMMRNLSEESLQTPVVQKISGMIYHSIERFKKTLDDLTQIARLQREESDESIVRIDLRQVVDEVMLDLTSQIEEAGAQFEFNFQGDTQIRFSTKNARSIVYNLLSNAIKYRSPQRPVLIRVSCYPENGYQIFAVEDNGLGIDLSHESKIFAMFKRLHDHVEGTGVGLYIVKKIIENAGGKIEVQSKVGKGSTFTVFFRQSVKA